MSASRAELTRYSGSALTFSGSILSASRRGNRGCCTMDGRGCALQQHPAGVLHGENTMTTAPTIAVLRHNLPPGVGAGRWSSRSLGTPRRVTALEASFARPTSHDAAIAQGCRMPIRSPES
jgi:hypothetical protein